MVIFQPVVAGGLAAAYVFRGRYKPGAHAEVLTAGTDLRKLYTDGTPTELRTILNTPDPAFAGFTGPSLSTFGESTTMLRNVANSTGEAQ